MSAVAGGHCGDRWFVRVVLRRRSGEKVPARPLLVPGVVCEEVLEQPRRCLACTEPWLADIPSTKLTETVPGAIAAMDVFVNGCEDGCRVWSCGQTQDMDYGARQTRGERRKSNK
jgi:hypothetical protein